MPSFRTALVLEIVSTAPEGTQELTVKIGEEKRRAILYPRWAAPASVGDAVVVNTTAVELDLGTGGLDFVVWNQAVDSYDAPGGGHIMKLRYTPAQCEVLAVEAQESPHHGVMQQARTLDATPVVATSLHSQLLPVLCGLRRIAPDARVAYVMTDGAGIEASFSRTLRGLRELGWLRGVVTAGHAIGGDLESVTLHSGLLAARHVLDADVIVAGLGPGVVGTATPYGTTAIELGTITLAAQALGGRAVVCVRLSGTDPRPRHRGVSHHMVAALGWVEAAIDPSVTAVVAPKGSRELVADALPNYNVIECDAGDVLADLIKAKEFGLSVSHMGRTPEEDTLFFEAAAAAGAYAGRLVAGR